MGRSQWTFRKKVKDGPLWSEYASWEGEANTRKRFRDIPEPINLRTIDKNGNGQFKDDVKYVEFGVSTKRLEGISQPWYFTADVTFQATINLRNKDCPKIPGVDVSEIPTARADEADWVLGYKDGCLVKICITECPP